MDNWRKRIFEIIQRAEGDSRISRIYDIVMMVLIVASIALPSGVITASYLDELRNKQEEKEKGEAAQN